ncbi:TPA: DGQHR domain-containing protein [Photobacterium damselae]
MNRNRINSFNPVPSIKVTQGFGEFYVCAIKAKDLLNICQPIRAEVLDGEIENDPLDIGLNKPLGHQRTVGIKRPEQIAQYIKTGVAAFPNSIIIGANISEEGYLLEGDKQQWFFEDGYLKIKDNSLVAAIIDGQHRLEGYKIIQEEGGASLEDELVCSVYLNLPITYHAQLFSTINSTQRKVPKNLIYQLYQIDMDENKPEYWSPEVLSVYLSRAFGLDKNSPLHGRVVLAIDKDDTTIRASRDWSVSLSSLVEGILKLISKKPIYDRDVFYSKKMEVKKRTDLREDGSAWRHLYLSNKDREVYQNLTSFMKALFSRLPEDSAFHSSIGITAALDALRILLESGEAFEGIKANMNDSFQLINFDSLPNEKVTKSKSTLRNVLLLAFKKNKGYKANIKYNFNGLDEKYKGNFF